MNSIFEVHKLNAAGLEKAGDIAEGFNKLLEFLEVLNPGPSREMSLAKTHLEAACFYSKKAMAMAAENQAV